MLVADKEEMLRILDNNGNLTNSFELRSNVHKNGLYHQEVAFIPVNIMRGGGAFTKKK